MRGISSIVGHVADAQRYLNQLAAEQLKLLDPTVQRALANVARRNFKKGLIAGAIIGCVCTAAATALVRWAFRFFI